MSSENNKKELKNVIIINDFDYTQGGASKVAIDTANLLVENNKNLKVYFFSGDTKNDESLNPEIIRVCTEQGEVLKDKKKFRGIINGLYNFKAKKELKYLLKTLEPNETVIHVHGWTKCLSSSVFDIAFKMGFKVILTMHDYFTACPNGGYFNYKKNEICKLTPLSYKCIKCNCDSRSYAFKIYRLIRQKIYLNSLKKLKNAIAITDFSNNILRKTIRDDVKVFRINNPILFDKSIKKVNYLDNDYYLYVGRVSKEKGVDLFCQALTELKLKGIVVGDGDEKNKLSKEYPNIDFVGWKNVDEVKKYMQNAKYLIFPTKWYETMGLIVLEALRFGIPSLVSNTSAASEIANQKLQTGDTFECNVDSIKKCILNQKPFDVNRNLLDEYGIEKYYRELIFAYKQIL